ncbi:MAG: acyl-CoA dehydratase activase [Candidatus Humimicrobiaceae bacterium]
MALYLGYDIGSISVNRAILDESGKIISVLPYTRHQGDPLKLVKTDLKKVFNESGEGDIIGICFTGSGGKDLAGHIGINFVNEIEAVTGAVKKICPDTSSIIEIGGQDSKFIDLDSGDYAMNELCAAGTGSFLDQQASRFGLTIEKFSEMALHSKNPSTIAGRCSVFAKSDMIHLQQEAASDEDIAMGLCYAMARSFKSQIAKGNKFAPPVIFCGGVSFNMAMIAAFENTLKQEISIPKHQASMGAIGAALSLVEKGRRDHLDREIMFEKFDDYIENFAYIKEVFEPLSIEKSILPDPEGEKYSFGSGTDKVEAYIGIDVGSISTNVVAIDSNRKLIAKKYLRTAGRPIEAVRKGIEDVGDQIKDKVVIKGVGTTGSGRYLTGDFVGADIVINEITAQATAAADIDPEVDTIFEIGGQDSKYISLEDGVVIDFEMNKVCAAGTGSFLEEQSERFDIKIEDFGGIAVSAKNPLNLGERCTVFMETNVYSHYQKGARTEDLLAGLAHSIVANYINRVVGRKKIGNKIFLQGAVAFNHSVVAAFEKYTSSQIIVPPNHEVTGAIGAAIRAIQEIKTKNISTDFRGFDEIPHIQYSQSSFECKKCPNNCEIKKISITDRPPLFYGGRCERYEKASKKTIETPDYFAMREELLMNSYTPAVTDTGGNGKDPDIKKVGMPYAMLTFEFYPFWKAFFTELGFDLILSDKTNKKIINDGVQLAVAETCFPMKATLGHVKNLLDKDVDYIFLPTTRDMPTKKNNIKGDRTGSYPCPFIQGTWSIVKAAMDLGDVKMLAPIINFSFKEYAQEKQLAGLGRDLGKNIKDIRVATKKAYKAQSDFYSGVKSLGGKILSELGKDETAIVISSRSYNSCDSAISMDVPKKLRSLGLKVIPLDFLPIDKVDLSDDWPNLYWEFGDRILSAAEIIKKDPRLYPTYITNFGCGPDSFILQYFERAMDRPFLKLEVDEHSAGAGVITRCEAFIDSLRNIKNKEKDKKTRVEAVQDKETIGKQELSDGSNGSSIAAGEMVSGGTEGQDSLLQGGFLNKELPAGGDNGNGSIFAEATFKKSQGRTIYIPYMGDSAIVLKHAFRSAGIDAEMLHSDDETLKWGRRYTLGKECYPFIITTGDIIKTLKNTDPKKAAFLMPQTHGPCRFGQYNKMQKIIIQELGYHDVPIIAPGAPENSQFYKEYDMKGKRGLELLLKGVFGINTVDYLNKALRQIRPYEKEKGLTEKIYEDYVKKVCLSVENDPMRGMLDKLASILADARAEFETVPVDRKEKPLIGIVGEIFVRNHPYSNNEIIRNVEALGGEVEIPTIGEWPDHTTATRKLDIITKQTDLYYKLIKYFSSNGNGSELSKTTESFGEILTGLIGGVRFYVSNRMMNRYLIHSRRKLEKPLRGFLREEEENGIYQVWENAEPYIIKWFGEAALSVGKSVEWIKNGANGIINVLPFTCIPGNIVSAISKSIKEDYRIPWLNLAFDGLEQGTTETRLEAFMYQTAQHLKNKKS